MAFDSTAAFFGKLKSLCHHIDKNVASLKCSLNQPAGLKPHLYDTALRTLKKDVEDLKEESEVINQQLMPTSNFSRYLEAMEELVNSQKKDIDKMEHYLTKFGYTPLPKPVENMLVMEANQKEANEDEGKKGERCDSTVVGSVLPSTPVLTSQLTLQGKELSLQPSAQRISHQVSVSITSEPQDTPVTSRTERLGVGNGVVPPGEDTHKPGVSLLPEEKRENQPWHSNAHMPNQHGHNETPVRAGPSSKYVGGEPIACHTRLQDTPEEPQLSEYTMQLLSTLRSAESSQSNIYATSNVPHTRERETTGIPADPAGRQLNCNERKMYTPQIEDQSPCEPVLSCDVGHHKGNFIDNKTPEEPALISEVGLNKKNLRDNKTPEEPALSHEAGFLMKSHRDNITPEEPVLSCGAGQNIGNFRAKRTPEEPELTTTGRSRLLENIAGKVASTAHEYENDIPCSPEVTEITRSVLSLTTQDHQLNHRGSSTATHYNKPRQHKIGTSFSDMYSMLSAPPSPDEQPPREVLQPLSSNLRTNYKSGAEKSTLTVSACSSTTMENFLGFDAVPPSPQLSDVTQRILGQLRR